MRLARSFIVTLIIAGLLAACGVRGHPEAPAGAKPANKDEPFILDPVID